MIKGLNGINDLSDVERKRYIDQQISAGKLTKRSRPRDWDRLYRNQQYIKKYGLENFQSRSVQDRDYIWKRDILQEEANNRYNPFELSDSYRTYTPAEKFKAAKEGRRLEDEYLGKEMVLNHNKGVGNEETWRQIQELANNDLDALESLMNSNWKPSPMFNKELEKAAEERRNAQIEMQKAARWAPSAAGDILGKRAISDEIYGTLADEKAKENNDKIFNDIYNKYLNKRESQYSQYKDARTQQILADNKDTPNNINTAYHKLIDELIPRLSAMYEEQKDKEGNLVGWKRKGSEMQDFSIEDKAALLAKAEVLLKVLPYEDAVKQLDNYAQEYVAGSRSWWRGAQLDLKDFANRGMNYLAGYATGVMQYYEDSRGVTDVWMNKDGEIIDSALVSDHRNGEGTYVENGEVHGVRKVTMSRGDLFRQGKSASGADLDFLINKKDLNDAERYNIFPWDKEGLERARELGHSNTELTYAPGESANFWTEAAKMGIYPLIDGIVSVATGGIGTGVGTTAKTLAFMRGTLGAISIGDAYGNGVYEENLQNNLSKLDADLTRKVREEGQSRFIDDYTSNAEFKAGVDDYVEYRAQELEAQNRQIEFNAEGTGTAKSTKGIEYWRAVARQEAIDKYTADIAEDIADEIKESPEYLKDIAEAHEVAADAATITALTDAAKYWMVNNFGYRKFLFATKAQRAAERTRKLASKVKETEKGLESTGSVLQGKPWWKTGSGRIFMGKRTAAQMWGGGWTNWTDEMQANAGRQINEDRFSAYLNGDYDDAGDAQTYSALSSYMSGVIKALPKESTDNAFWIGAVGSAFSFMPNIAGIVNTVRNEKSREEWKKSTFAEKVNSLISNGILNDYATQIASERNINNYVEAVNKFVDDNDQLKALRKAVSKKTAKTDATDEEDENTLNFLEAIGVAKALKETFKPSDAKDATELDIIANEHSKIKDAMAVIDKLSSENFSEEEAEEFLKDYYIQNKEETSTPENDQKAIQEIIQNAKELKEALNTYDEVNEKLNKVEESRGYKINPDVRDELLERAAVTKYLKKRREEKQKNVLGRTEDSDAEVPFVPEVYGTRAGVERQLRAIEKSLTPLESSIENATKERDKAKTELEEFDKKHGITEKKKRSLSKDLTEERENLQYELESREQQLDYLNTMKDIVGKNKENLEKRSNDLLQSGLSGETPRILTKNEILNLDAVSRARMLNPEYREDYSKEQLAEIDKVITELRNKDPNAEKDVQDIAKLTLQIGANERAYSMMLEHPEAAYFQINSDKNTADSFVNTHRALVVDNWLSKAATDPEYTKERIEQELFETLKMLNPTFLQSMEEVNPDNENGLDNLWRYKDIIKKAREWSSYSSMVSKEISKLGISQDEKKQLRKEVHDAISTTSHREEILPALERASENNENMKSLVNGVKNTEKGISNAKIMHDLYTLLQSDPKLDEDYDANDLDLFADALNWLAQKNVDLSDPDAIYEALSEKEETTGKTKYEEHLKDSPQTMFIRFTSTDEIYNNILDLMNRASERAQAIEARNAPIKVEPSASNTTPERAASPQQPQPQPQPEGQPETPNPAEDNGEPPIIPSGNTVVEKFRVVSGNRIAAAIAAGIAELSKADASVYGDTVEDLKAQILGVLNELGDTKFVDETALLRALNLKAVELSTTRDIKLGHILNQVISEINKTSADRAKAFAKQSEKRFYGNPNAGVMATIDMQNAVATHPNSPISNFIKTHKILEFLKDKLEAIISESKDPVKIYFFTDSQLTEDVKGSMGKDNYNQDHKPVIIAIQHPDGQIIGKDGKTHYQPIGIMPNSEDSNVRGSAHMRDIRHLSEDDGMIMKNDGGPLTASFSTMINSIIATHPDIGTSGTPNQDLTILLEGELTDAEKSEIEDKRQSSPGADRDAVKKSSEAWKNVKQRFLKNFITYFFPTPDENGDDKGFAYTQSNLKGGQAGPIRIFIRRVSETRNSAGQTLLDLIQNRKNTEGLTFAGTSARQISNFNSRTRRIRSLVDNGVLAPIFNRIQKGIAIDFDEDTFLGEMGKALNKISNFLYFNKAYSIRVYNVAEQDEAPEYVVRVVDEDGVQVKELARFTAQDSQRGNDGLEDLTADIITGLLLNEDGEYDTSNGRDFVRWQLAANDVESLHTGTDAVKKIVRDNISEMIDDDLFYANATALSYVVGGVEIDNPITGQSKVEKDAATDNAASASSAPIGSTEGSNGRPVDANSGLPTTGASPEIVPSSNAASNAQTIIAKIKADSGMFELLPDESGYRNKKTGRILARVTKVKSADEHKGKPWEEGNIWETPSTTVGNTVDTIVRDFFDGVLRNTDVNTEFGRKYITRSLANQLGLKESAKIKDLFYNADDNTITLKVNIQEGVDATYTYTADGNLSDITANFDTAPNVDSSILNAINGLTDEVHVNILSQFIGKDSVLRTNLTNKSEKELADSGIISLKPTKEGQAAINEILKREKIETENLYPNITKESYRRVIDFLTRQKAKWESDGWTIAANGIKAVGTLDIYTDAGVESLDVCGTLDILLVKGDGKTAKVVDVKTIHRKLGLSEAEIEAEYKNGVAERKPGWELQTSIYQKFETDSYGLNIIGREILPFEVTYTDPDVAKYTSTDEGVLLNNGVEESVDVFPRTEETLDYVSPHIIEGKLGENEKAILKSQNQDKYTLQELQSIFDGISSSLEEAKRVSLEPDKPPMDSNTGVEEGIDSMFELDPELAAMMKDEDVSDKKPEYVMPSEYMWDNLSDNIKKLLEKNGYNAEAWNNPISAEELLNRRRCILGK